MGKSVKAVNSEACYEIHGPMPLEDIKTDEVVVVVNGLVVWRATAPILVGMGVARYLSFYSHYLFAEEEVHEQGIALALTVAHDELIDRGLYDELLQCWNQNKRHLGWETFDNHDREQRQ
jgi:hypothetical protein